MKKITLLSLFIIVSSFAICQEVDTTVIKYSDETIYTEVDSTAHFPGGRPEWIKYITTTLNANVGVENSAKKGRYDVVIMFTVMKDGTLKDFKPKTKYGHGFEQEVIRVLKKSPKWVPAKKNGVNVNSVTTQNLVFNISVG